MTYHFKVGLDGRTITLPYQLVQQLGLTPGTDVVGEVEGASMRMTAAKKADPLTELRQVMRGYTMEQFLADRRRDGAG